VDENVEKILAALDETGLADDTVVIYTSDNGYYLGEHGLGDKRTAYEESLRIPFLVRYPRKIAAGTVVRELVLNMDLAPTLLSWAGVEGDWEMMGRDASGVLAGVAEEGWRKSFLYESYQDPEYADVTFDVRAVRTERGKLVTYPGRPEWTQVFDLLADPTEVKNLAGTGSEVERELRVELTRLGG
jgi:arylsulfatase A-like enzyme